MISGSLPMIWPATGWSASSSLVMRRRTPLLDHDLPVEQGFGRGEGGPERTAEEPEGEVAVSRERGEDDREVDFDEPEAERPEGRFHPRQYSQFPGGAPIIRGHNTNFPDLDFPPGF